MQHFLGASKPAALRVIHNDENSNDKGRRGRSCGVARRKHARDSKHFLCLSERQLRVCSSAYVRRAAGMRSGEAGLNRKPGSGQQAAGGRAHCASWPPPPTPHSSRTPTLLREVHTHSSDIDLGRSVSYIRPYALKRVTMWLGGSWRQKPSVSRMSSSRCDTTLMLSKN